MMVRRIPLEDFFRKPQRAQLRLSPSGRFLAYLAPWERRMNVHVRDLETGVETRVTAATARDVLGFCFVSDRRLLYVQDTAGDENTRLYAVDVDGANQRDLTPYENVKASLVDDLEDLDDIVLFQMNRRDPEVFDVFRLDTRTGAMESIAENPGNVQAWLTDHDGKLRVATTTDGVNTSILYRATEADEWGVVATYDFKESATPLSFTFDGKRLHVSSNVGRDKAAIFEYDPATGVHGKLIFEHPEVDVADLLYSRRRRIVTGVAFETARLGYQFFDSRRAEIQRFLDERLQGRDNRLSSHSRDENHYVVYSGSERDLGSYWLLDVEQRELSHLFDLAPWLVAAELAPLHPIEYRARDGLRIPAYLTLPLGVEPKNLPVVVNPHGGPWVRDSFGFHPEVQFLANRGFAVLQMNYRSSAGYGREFLEAGFRQWGRAMQDDISDGVKHLIEQGIADPRRVAIYGGSYGGYATLAGMTLTPELYACGASYVGISNLFTWIESFPPYWKPYLEMIHEMVGHPERDKAQFEATSPLFHVGRIRSPLFIAHGRNDPRVKQAESDQIVAALRSRGIEVEYLVKDDEGHGFHNEENQFEFYRRLEAFLEKHLHAARSAT
jgi:dipeptidyl aminopeptidase/acylaminoacyl peptidase